MKNMETDTAAQAWELLMAETVSAAREGADYQPGAVLAPGSGTTGDDPLGLHYADLGPLAFILNEAMDSAVNRGIDRESLLEGIAQVAGEGITAADADDVLTDNVQCPPAGLLQAFASELAIDMEIIYDAGRRGGCTCYGTDLSPPGY